MKNQSSSLLLLALLLCLPLQQVFSQEPVSAEESSILERTLGLDIKTAGYYELLAWCEKLGLSQKGTLKDLQSRLYAYYGLIPEQEKPEELGGKIVTISSASSTEYFTLEQIEENYIVLESNVVLEMKDNDRQSTHNIKADKIIFNQTKNIITASGNVEYTLVEQDNTDFFRGESLTFNIDSWEGVFFSGVSETDRTIEEETVTFYYSGDTIHRSEKDIITLTDGTVTSSEGPNPNYRIKAKKIWVLAPGEWAFLSAALYIGHIPVLYLPFFYHAGDTLFFHPAIGSREKEGFFIQTTTYLLGEKEDKESTISFLQIGEEDGETYEKEIRGLYLRKTDPLSSEDAAKKKKVSDSGSFIKVIIDLYTRLGMYAGLEGNLADYGILKQFKFLASLAETRNIYEESNAAYTFLSENDEGEYVSYWHKSYIGSAIVPFRYGLSGLLQLNHTIFTLKSEFEYYSDPFYLLHFSTREEDINWSSLIGLESEEETTTTDNVATEDTLTWSASGSITPPISTLQPYISSMKLENISATLGWRSKDIDTTDLDTYKDESDWTEFTFPEQKFYYPDNYVTPDASFSLNGTLISYPWKTKPKTEEPQDEKKAESEKKAAPPWEIQNGDSTDSTAAVDNEEVLRIPERMKELPIPAPVTLTPFKFDLSYKLNPKLTVSTQVDSSSWTTREEIDFANSYSLLTAYGTGSLTANARILENFVVLTNAFSIAYDFRNHFNNRAIDDEDEWLEKRKQVYSDSYVKLLNNSTLTVSPFYNVPQLKTSSVSYTLNTLLMKRTFDFDSLSAGSSDPVFLNEYILWDTDFITNHSLNTKLEGNLWNKLQAINLNVVLPPLDGKITTTISLYTGPLTSLFSWGIEETAVDSANPDSGMEWTWKNHEINETLTFADFGTFSQYFTYNVEQTVWNTSKSTIDFKFLNNNISFTEVFRFGGTSFPEEDSGSWNLFLNPTESISTLKLYWLTTSFTARKTIPYSFETDQGWVAESDSRFIPEKISASINYKSDFDPFWKNRIFISTNFAAGYTMNLIRYTENSLNLSLDFSVDVYKFIKLKFSAQSENKYTYRYISGICERMGLDPINPLTDIINSLNFFDIEKRKEALFKAKKISFDLTHHLGDWDLTLQYSGTPELITDDDGFKQYEWDRSLTILVKWNPIPEIKKELTYDNDSWNF